MDQVFLYINTEHSVQEVMTLLYIKLLYKMDHYTSWAYSISGLDCLDPYLTRKRKLNVSSRSSRNQDPEPTSKKPLDPMPVKNFVMSIY